MKDIVNLVLEKKELIEPPKTNESRHAEKVEHYLLVLKKQLHKIKLKLDKIEKKLHGDKKDDL